MASCLWIPAVAEVAVLGLGRMGSAMALKLAEAGHSVRVWNRSPQAAVELVARDGANSLQVGATASEAAAGAEIVITILADAAATQDVLLGGGDAVGVMSPGTIVCDMCTGGVVAARELGAALTARGIRFVDAPVSGSVPTIEAGQLLVLASGDQSAVSELAPVLAAFAKRVAFLGDAGAGQAMKLAVNLIVFSLNSAVSEALALADHAGIALDAAYDVFQDSVIAAPLVNYKRAAFLDPTTPVAMSLDLVLKDMGLITGQAEAAGTSLATAGAVRDEVAAACAAGFGASDMASLARWLRREDGD